MSVQIEIYQRADVSPRLVTPTLKQNVVQVWDFSFSHNSIYHLKVDELFGVLSEEERRRARRYYFMKDRIAFVLSRATLRVVLGSYLGDSPERVSLCYARRGKPFICGSPSLYFNLSHTEGKVLIAITNGREVGVDIERIRSDFTTLQVAQYCFLSNEVKELRQLSGKRQQEAFFHYWTRKEAYVKARGDGLSFPLNEVDVTGIDEQLRVLNAGVDSHWMMQDLPIHPDYAASLAIDMWRSSRSVSLATRISSY